MGRFDAGLSPWTVKHHLANARSKVGASTTAQLVWILAELLPEPEASTRDQRRATLSRRLNQPMHAVDRAAVARREGARGMA